MSRSLDKDVLESLKSENATAVYKDISEILVSLPENGRPLEIELLGKAHPLEPGVNFLQDENAIAIPKLRLTQAFFVAREVIQKHLASQLQIPNSHVMAATAVALLMDPEHLTAANIRKRFILSRLDSNVQSRTLLLDEKQFLDSLLTARLHRHTKSPTLWNHRRWLTERFNVSGISPDLRQELAAVVMIAAERHPRNYYAWHHARWLVCNVGCGLDTSVLGYIIDDVKIWCFKHHDDISGWAYLIFIISSILAQETRSQKCSAIVAETLQMAESFRWTNESVWVFLRTVVSRDAISPELCESFYILNKKLFLTVEEETAKEPLAAAIQWVSCFRQDVQ